MIKYIVKRIIPSFVKSKVKNVLHFLDLEKALHQEQQALLRLLYPEVRASLSPKEKIKQSEFKVFSQNGEDGILLHLFREVGTTNHVFVEFGVEDGKECNTANLSVNFGWKGLLMDGADENVQRGRFHYKKLIGSDSGRVRFEQAFITAENIDTKIMEYGFEGEIDLLSIDLDGNDYWVWKAISVISPRIVVIEYNPSLGPKKSLTVKYDPTFSRLEKHPSGMYHGASLSALNKLAIGKGYQLVGCDSCGVNAFFVRSDVMGESLQALRPEEAYYPMQRRNRKMTLEDQWNLIKHLEYEEI